MADEKDQVIKAQFFGGLGVRSSMVQECWHLLQHPHCHTPYSFRCRTCFSGGTSRKRSLSMIHSYSGKSLCHYVICQAIPRSTLYPCRLVVFMSWEPRAMNPAVSTTSCAVVLGDRRIWGRCFFPPQIEARHYYLNSNFSIFSAYHSHKKHAFQTLAKWYREKNAV